MFCCLSNQINLTAHIAIGLLLGCHQSWQIIKFIWLVKIANINFSYLYYVSDILLFSGVYGHTTGEIPWASADLCVDEQMAVIVGMVFKYLISNSCTGQ